MCGFVGLIELDGLAVDRSMLDRMSSRLNHRGPDGEGVYVSGSVGFGFRRLSILDLLPTGNQPMISPNGEIVLVFNGEIYNYIELRDELQNLGHQFKSTGDTEVLLHAYMQWGKDCVVKLNGMWAFLVYDRRQNLIFGSRDRFGEKPLYYYRDSHRIVFGSEIKAILASDYYRAKPNWQAVSRFLLDGRLDHPDTDTGKETFYDGIEQVAPGSAFELTPSGTFSSWSYWSLPQCIDSEIADPAEAFYDLFEDSLRLRLRSDVPVGLFLSGGLDSTSITCGWTRLNPASPPGSIVAFTYQPEEYDETLYINDTVAQTAVQLVQFQPEPEDLWGKLQKVLWFQDEPVHSLAAVISFELTRLASERGVKVILNGGGPDEFIGGYHTFFPNYWASLLRSGQIREVWREIHAYCEAHGCQPSSTLRKFIFSQSKAELARISTLRHLVRWIKRQRSHENSWFTADLHNRAQVENNEYTEPTLESTLKTSVEQSPLPLYLRIEDRNSMAHSVEMRMPYLDHRLVSFAFQLPPHWKMHGPWNKYVMRMAMRDRIPESVRNRLQKFGFPAPAKKWFANGLYEPMQDLLNSRSMRERGIYNLASIRRDLEAHRQGIVDVSSTLFNLAQFEIWSEQLRGS